MNFNLSESLTSFQEAAKDSFQVGDAEELLDRITGALAVSSEAINDQSTYEGLEELVHAYPSLNKRQQQQVIYLVTSSTHNQAENSSNIIDNGETDLFPLHKQYLEMYAYFAHCLLSYLSLENMPTSNHNSKKVTNQALEIFKNNCTQLENIMNSICAVFKLNLNKLFTTTPERDLFISSFTRPIYILMENEPRIKVTSVKMYMFKVISMAVKFHGHGSAAQSAIVQNLTYFSHLNAMMAELLQILNDQYDHFQLTEDVLREVSNKEFNSNDNNGPKQISLFIVKVSELIPRILLKQMTLVSQLLNNSSYTLRCAVVEACGNIIIEISKDEDELERYRNQASGLLDLLIERFLDQNPYVRTKAIQSILKLCEIDAKFTKYRQTFVEISVRSLEDKSSLVRRNAVKLMSRLVLTHPFGALHGTQLTLSVWEKRLQEAQKELKALEPADTTEAVVERNLEHDSDEEDEEEPASRIEKESDTNTIFKIKLTIKYYEDAIEFIQLIHHGVEVASQLLYSKNKNEVIETMDFFVLADAYFIENVGTGIRRMLHLVWMKTNNDEGMNVANHLVECYKNLFLLAPEDASELEQAALIAKNLISLTYSATVPELASLEKLLGLMYESSLINETVIKVLWQIYSFQNQTFSKKQRRGSIIVLGMLALSDNEITMKGIDALLTIGLGPKGKEDLILAKYSCIALYRVVPNDKNITLSKVPREKEAIEKLGSLLIEYNSNSEYFSVAEQAINTIFNISSKPEEVTTEIIKQKTKMTFGKLIEGQSQVVSLSQLLFIVGHVAIKVIVHLEVLEGQFKKKKIEAEIAKNKGDKKDEDANELEMIGGTSEDDFADAVAFIKEKEILYGENSLLAKFGPLVKEICSNNLKYDNKILQRSAVLCMEKLMCVSSKYCEDNLALLITIMERSTDPIIRSNAVLGLGDMAVCFNNLVDENTDFLYRRLHDDELMVKRTCLMTITFLILAGQVKVKGQLSQMAKCLEDEDQGISDMCKLFFTELATKDNAIYNGFIDIFSGLSNDEDLSKDAMKRIIKFLVSFIEKERHQKQLSDKLVQRINKVENEKQWNDVAFVLGALPVKNDTITQILEDGYKMVAART
ncbi:Condensin complex subunit 1 [Wickerhamomyces ciferrii]|uniref:Condensin complex subunit 1 n=1 Tax=Wickerhamomyces ciferrii (strain ATCC 14091 / BCRC 22168 / CBS 111 / JCM 3599 / NBRC 0793 / NRRL Y-1031 F-60-10) TaxID=1206466 RepID=K0KG41_WICCF|nr:Condensin complex subunit 1 [Wickerhamomyces ciferrii]CCH41911.1 Condensin complex subunit 1 [Wickerhamomyces ciferrii]